MNYRFSNLSGKIVETAGKVGKNFKKPSEAPEIIYVGAKFSKISNEVQKKTKSGLPLPPAKLVAKYKHFQVDNGIPIHLKGGTTDYVLYVTTILLCAYGLIECGRFYYSSAFPKRAE